MATVGLRAILVAVAANKLPVTAGIMISDLDERCGQSAPHHKYHSHASFEVPQGLQRHPEWTWGSYVGFSVTHILERHGILCLTEDLKLAVRKNLEGKAEATHEAIITHQPIGELRFTSRQCGFYQTPSGVYVLEEAQKVSATGESLFWILKKMEAPATTA